MGGPSYGRRIAEIRAAADAARDAQRKADEMACKAWNMRMSQEGGPTQPSPSLRAAINGKSGRVGQGTPAMGLAR